MTPRITADDVRALMCLLPKLAAHEPPLVVQLTGPLDADARVWSVTLMPLDLLRSRPRVYGAGATIGDAIRAALEELRP